MRGVVFEWDGESIRRPEDDRDPVASQTDAWPFKRKLRSGAQNLHKWWWSSEGRFQQWLCSTQKNLVWSLQDGALSAVRGDGRVQVWREVPVCSWCSWIAPASTPSQVQDRAVPYLPHNRVLSIWTPVSLHPQRRTSFKGCLCSSCKRPNCGTRCSEALHLGKFGFCHSPTYGGATGMVWPSEKRDLQSVRIAKWGPRFQITVTEVFTCNESGEHTGSGQTTQLLECGKSNCAEVKSNSGSHKQAACWCIDAEMWCLEWRWKRRDVPQLLWFFSVRLFLGMVGCAEGYKIPWTLSFRVNFKHCLLAIAFFTVNRFV